MSALLHFYSDKNIGDAAILAALRKLTDEPDLAPYDGGALPNRLISVGGDIFNNGRPGLITRRFLSKLRDFDIAPERTMLFGQSIPPSCSGFSLSLLARKLRRIRCVTVRDARSQKRLQKHGVRAGLSVDCAFALDKTDAAPAGDLFAAAGLKPEKTALFSLRSFNRMYPLDETEFLDRIAETANRLATEGYAPALLVQANVDAADTDHAAAAALRARVPSLAVIDPFRSDDPWRKAFGALSEAGIVVGARYHTAVLRMAAGRLPIGLWYSDKGADLHERFDVPGGPADTFDPAYIAEAALCSASRTFNDDALRRQVFSDFAHACVTENIAA